MDSNVLMFYIFGGLGGLLMLLGLLGVIKGIIFGATAVVVTGTVTGAKRYKGPETGSKARFYPSVRFQTADGDEREFQSRAGFDVEPEIGSPIEVSYPPRRPDRVEVHAGGCAWVGGVFVFMMGALFAGIGAAIHYLT